MVNEFLLYPTTLDVEKKVLRSNTFSLYSLTGSPLGPELLTQAHFTLQVKGSMEIITMYLVFSTCVGVELLVFKFRFYGFGPAHKAPGHNSHDLCSSYTTCRDAANKKW